MLKPIKEMETTASEPDEGEIDDLEVERDIAREIEDAFATVTYPGDDKLVRYPDYHESDDVVEGFRGKHWRDMSLDVLSEHWFALGLFSPEAFRFYLPCFLIAALLHSDVTGILWETVFLRLTPPASDGDDMDWLLKLVSLLDARQKAAILRYIELWVQTETGFVDSGRERTLPFWQRTSPTESAQRDRNGTEAG
jgi:hypothetical protein